MDAPGKPALTGGSSGSGIAAAKATPKRKRRSLQLKDDKGTCKKKSGKKENKNSDRVALKLHHTLMIVLGKVRATITQGNAKLVDEPWLKGLLEKVSVPQMCLRKRAMTSSN